MSTNALFRRGLPLLAIVMAALTFPGCGEYYEEDYYGGTLEVANDFTSVAGINYVNVWVSGGPVETFAVFLMPNENPHAFIDLFPDTYTVELEWSDGFNEQIPFVDIFDHATTLVVGVN